MLSAMGGNAQSALLERRSLWLVITLVLVAMPFSAAEYIPSTDLPQHAAQVRLLEEAWGLSDKTLDTSLFEVRAFGANVLVYYPMFLLGRVFSLRLAAKLTVLLILLGSVVGLHQLARTRGRDPVHALLAALALFSSPLYWGFLNFLCGLPLFLWLLARLLGHTEGRLSRRTLAFDAGLLVLLYGAHVFWVALAGLACLLTELPRPTWRRFAFRAVSFLPAAFLLCLWYPKLLAARREAGFDLGTHYLTPLGARLSLSWLSSALFGGLQGMVEPICTVLVAAYALMAVVWARRQGRLNLDRKLVSLGLVLWLFAFFGPNQYFNTILLNRRFMALSVMLLLLALPSLPGPRTRGASAAVGVAFSLFTAFTWALFDQVDLSGLRESLARIPAGASVLGLDLRKSSVYVRDRPFLQVFAYAQAEHGGDLAFSFAEHSSSIVAYRERRKVAWTRALEWLPERVTKRDVQLFDCILVNGTPAQQAGFAQAWGRESAIRHGFFRVYCHDASSAPSL